MTDTPIGQHWRDGAIYFATGRSEEESLEYIRTMPRAVLKILRGALEDTDPFKEGGQSPAGSPPEASALADQEAAPVIATVVAAARAGDAGAIKFLRTRVCDQAWRLDPENDWRQPEVAEILKKRMADNGE